MIKSNYKILRQKFYIQQMTGQEYKIKKPIIEQQIKDLRKQVIKAARLIGISDSNMEINTDFYKEYQPIGEICPIPETWEEALSQAYPGAAVVSVTIRDKSELNKLNKEWLDEKSAEMKKLISKFGKLRGQVEWQKTGNWKQHVVDKVFKNIKY